MDKKSAEKLSYDLDTGIDLDWEEVIPTWDSESTVDDVSDFLLDQSKRYSLERGVPDYDAMQSLSRGKAFRNLPKHIKMQDVEKGAFNKLTGDDSFYNQNLKVGGKVNRQLVAFRIFKKVAVLFNKMSPVQQNRILQQEADTLALEKRESDRMNRMRAREMAKLGLGQGAYFSTYGMDPNNPKNADHFKKMRELYPLKK